MTLPDPDFAPTSVFEPAVYVRQAAALLGLPLPPDLEMGVIANFEHIYHLAQPLLAFPLSDTLESAATFDPAPDPALAPALDPVPTPALNPAPDSGA